MSSAGCTPLPAEQGAWATCPCACRAGRVHVSAHHPQTRKQTRRNSCRTSAARLLCGGRCGGGGDGEHASMRQCAAHAPDSSAFGPASAAGARAPIWMPPVCAPGRIPPRRCSCANGRSSYCHALKAHSAVYTQPLSKRTGQCLSRPHEKYLCNEYIAGLGSAVPRVHRRICVTAPHRRAPPLPGRSERRASLPTAPPCLPAEQHEC